MMAISKLQNDGGEVLGDLAVAKALKARRLLRIKAALMATAAIRPGDSAPWFVLSIWTNSEIAVEKLLDEGKVECWLPRKKDNPKLRRGGRPVADQKARLMPAFPGYLFVRIVPSNENIRTMLDVEGVTGILAADEKPFPVSDKIVRKLKAMIDAGELDRTVSGQMVRRGDKVAVKEGPFAWAEGEVDWIEKAKAGPVDGLHVRVLLSLFGRVVTTKLTLAQIAKME